MKFDGNLPPDVIKKVKTERKWIALTFDDGPFAPYTEQLLDILAEHNAKSTLFVVGEELDRRPETAQRAAAEGHELANHTYFHPELPLISSEERIRELRGTHERIVELTGQAPTLFRPPYGIFNDEVLEDVRLFGYKTVLWSDGFEMEDWEKPGS